MGWLSYGGRGTRTPRPRAPTGGGIGVRQGPVDALRGLIMVVMSLDQANYLIARAHGRVEF